MVSAKVVFDQIEIESLDEDDAGYNKLHQSIITAREGFFQVLVKFINDEHYS